MLLLTETHLYSIYCILGSGITSPANTKFYILHQMKKTNKLECVNFQCLRCSFEYISVSVSHQFAPSLCDQNTSHVRLSVIQPMISSKKIWFIYVDDTGQNPCDRSRSPTMFSRIIWMVYFLLLLFSEMFRLSSRSRKTHQACGLPNVAFIESANKSKSMLQNRTERRPNAINSVFPLCC